MAGRSNSSYKLIRLNYPKGLFVNRKETIFVADTAKRRIMKYTLNNMVGRQISCKNISGYGPSELGQPSDVIFDKYSKSLIISDTQNRRVLQWFPNKKTKILIKNIACSGLAIANDGSFYVCDTEKHRVVRYQMHDHRKTVVAGDHGQGSRLKQLNHPTYVFVGPSESVYVSDSGNDRVVKWDKGASVGVLVAGGKGKGRGQSQLDYPMGLIVDQLGTIYVADHQNHRVMRWRKNASCGELIAGDKHLAGDASGHLNGPDDLMFDSDGNLYVADSNNNRIQRFDIDTT